MVKKRGAFASYAVLAIISVRAFAADYHVAPDGDDTNDGLTVATAWRSIEMAINRVDAGDTVWVHDGVYRGRITFTNTRGRADALITLAAYPGASPVLKGSVVVTNWYQENNLWYTPLATNAQQVFVDGQLLIQLGWPSEFLKLRACHCGTWIYLPYGYRCTQIPGSGLPLEVGDPRTNMPPGSFYYHAPEQKLYVRLVNDAPPTNRFIEVSQFQGVLYDHSPVGFLRVRGLRFAHANTFTSLLLGGPVVLIGLYGSIEDSIIEWGDSVGLTLRHNSTALRCTVRNNGMLGINCNAFTNMLIKQCLIVSNNYRAINASYSGGIKIIPHAGATVEECEVAWNNGNGIWFDTNAGGHPIFVRNNYVHNNFIWTNRSADQTYAVTAGIFIELTEHAVVQNNLVISNGAAGIHLSGSRSTRVENNLIMGTRAIPGGHRAYGSLMMHNPVPGYPVVSNRIFNNLVIFNYTDYDIIAVRSNNTTIFDNEINHNLYYRGSGAGSVFPNSAFSAAFVGYGAISSFSEWRNRTGWDANSLTNHPQTAPNGRPLAGSPAIDAGTVTAFLTSDYDGRPRPADGDSNGRLAVDIGPYEFMGGSIVFVDAQSTNPVPPFASWETAATNIAQAFASAPTGSLVAVRPGWYELTDTLTLDRHLALVGNGPREEIILDARSNGPVARMIVSNSILNELTLRGGFTSQDGGAVSVAGGAILQNVLIKDSSAGGRGGGVFAEAGAVLRNLVIENCAAFRGGGVYASAPRELTRVTVRSCQATADGAGFHLSGNSTASWLRAEACVAGGEGGGAFVGAGQSVWYSEFSSNTAVRGGGIRLTDGGRCWRSSAVQNSAQWGGGVYADSSSTFIEGRIIHNSASQDGGGAYAESSALLLNSLVHDNASTNRGGGLWLSGSATGLFITAVANSAHEGGGAYLQGASTRLVNSILWSNRSIVAGAEEGVLENDALALHSLASSPLAGPSNIVGNPVFANFAGRDLRIRQGSAAIDAAMPIAGITNDLITVTRLTDGNADGSVLPDIGAYENLQMRYVRADSPSPQQPYASWDTAANLINDALNLSVDGDIVLVGPGTHAVWNHSLTRGITLRSSEGPQRTILEAGGVNRALTINHPNALVEGFTIRGGRADAGGGVYLANGRLSSCILYSNVSNGALGGQFTYLPSIPYWYCRASYDTMIHEGGGAVAVLHGGVIDNCVIYSNTAHYGGGVVAVNGGHLNHVTIAGNFSTNGAGLYLKSGATIRNSIIYHNSGSANYLETGTAAVWHAVTATPLPAGTDNSDADPLFMDGGAGNFELADGSPAIDSASASPISSVDVLGRNRPLDGDGDGLARADRGAYERIHPTVDTDGDGVPDISEWQSGTGMTDPHEYLRVTGFLPDGEDWEVSWAGARGRLYSIWVSTNLFEGFQPLATNIPTASLIRERLSGIGQDRELFIAVSADFPPSPAPNE